MFEKPIKCPKNIIKCKKKCLKMQLSSKSTPY